MSSVSNRMASILQRKQRKGPFEIGSRLANLLLKPRPGVHTLPTLLSAEAVSVLVNPLELLALGVLRALGTGWVRTSGIQKLMMVSLYTALQLLQDLLGKQNRRLTFITPEYVQS